MAVDVTQRESQEFYLPSIHLDQAVANILSINRKRDHWYPELDDLDSIKTGPYIEEKLFERFNIRIEQDDEGSICGLHLNSKNIYSAHNLLFEAIAPLVKNGSYIEFSPDHDDTVFWRYVWFKGQVLTVDGKLAFEMPHETQQHYSNLEILVDGLLPRDVRTALSIVYTETDKKNAIWQLSPAAPGTLVLSVSLGSVLMESAELEWQLSSISKSLSCCTDMAHKVTYRAAS